MLSSDAAFDSLLPRRLRTKAPIHFTPVEVARHAANLLAPHAGMTVLDVGAGAGKFCLAAALAAPHATFVGVELREQLVHVATTLAQRLALANTRFIHANAFDLDWQEFDAFYLFNPFSEQLRDWLALDNSIDLDPDNFATYVHAVRLRLAAARIGTRLVTYHGFGAPPPLGYELVCRQLIASDCIELWIKTRAVGADVLFEEDDV